MVVSTAFAEGVWYHKPIQSPNILLCMDIHSTIRDMHHFQGGAIDTSSLLYLERLALLESAATCYRLLLIPQVAAEHGQSLPSTLVTVSAPSGPADSALCPVAARHQLAVISEDKQVLRQAENSGLTYFNTLMLLLIMLYNTQLTVNECSQLTTQLSEFAHYSRHVWRYGEQVRAYVMSLGREPSLSVRDLTINHC